MDRNVIHTQIAMLAEKINHLNELLSKEDILHPVELDLLMSYEKELRSAVEEMARCKGELKKVVKKEERAEKIVSAHEKELQTVEPVALENEEIAMHQHILEKMEKVEQVLNSERAELKETMQEPLRENAKMESVEELLVRQKMPVYGQSKNTKDLSLNERFRTETTPLSERLKGARKKSIKELFELNERYKFIEELFGGSADQFDKAIGDLGKMAGKRSEAERYLESIRAKYSWEKKQALADRFAGQVLEFLG